MGGGEPEQSHESWRKRVPCSWRETTSAWQKSPSRTFNLQQSRTTAFNQADSL